MGLRMGDHNEETNLKKSSSRSAVTLFAGKSLANVVMSFASPDTSSAFDKASFEGQTSVCGATLLDLLPPPRSRMEACLAAG